MIISMGCVDEHAEHCWSHYSAWFASNPLVNDENYILSQSLSKSPTWSYKMNSTIDVDFVVEILYQSDSNNVRRFCRMCSRGCTTTDFSVSQLLIKIIPEYSWFLLPFKKKMLCQQVFINWQSNVCSNYVSYALYKH